MTEYDDKEQIKVLHSDASYCRTLLDDNSSSALIILGFVMMSPLIVLAMAVYCGLARRLRLFMLFQPYTRALYKGVRWRWKNPEKMEELSVKKREQRANFVYGNRI
ncbi:unnamed protein product [Ranitomeya imitator]|uniref:Transmembrane protein n=1 Tax=Ranitomeya imitator TaxID=111125 RepID=A0ABN9LIE7_9NEOB|nr:unnamed protein product [Ranitomeya imitator]